MPPATDDTVAALDTLRREVEGCARCALHETRTRAVFGEGDYGAELMFVGEAPGYHEDQQGRPFVGAAGKLATGVDGIEFFNFFCSDSACFSASAARSSSLT